MEGSIRRRGTQSWELRVYTGRDAVTGAKRWSTRTVRGTKSDAQRELRALASTVDLSLAARTSSTVGELLERWLEHAEADLSPKTAMEVRRYLDRTLLPALGDVPVEKLRAHDIDAFYLRLRTSGGVNGEPLAAATVRKVHSILHRALAQGMRWGWIGVNPASAASPPRITPPEISPPSPSEVRRLFTVAEEDDPDFATFVLLAAGTGARRSEQIALRWSDIDLSKGQVRIGRGIVRGKHGLIEKDTKTHSVRRVSLDPTTVAVLRAHRARAEERARFCDAILPPSAFVFSNQVDGSEPWDPESVSRSFGRLCKLSQVKGVRLHDLRHYVATRLLSSGVDVRTVAGRLGHRNASTTLNVYSHFLPEADREAAEVLGRLFDETADPA